VRLCAREEGGEKCEADKTCPGICSGSRCLHDPVCCIRKGDHGCLVRKEVDKMVRKNLCIVFKCKDPGPVVTEHLRYAGLVSVGDRDRGVSMPYDAAKAMGPLKEGEIIVKMKCPPEQRAEVWQEQNLERLRSFGVKAEAFMY